MERALIPPPRLLEDPAWERAVLGPYVARARRRLFAQLESGVADTSPRAALIRAYRAVPFYQQRFARAAVGLHDLRDPRALSAIPLTRRHDLALGVESFLAHPVTPFALDRGWLGRTSGSTGAPVAYLRDPRTHAWFFAFLDFALAYVRAPQGGQVSPTRSVVLLDALDHMPEYDASLPLFHDARFAKRASRSPALAKELVALRPAVITGDPESLASLAALDLPAAARPSLVLSSAFPMPATLRDSIVRATGAPVLEYYATQETSVIAIGCRDGHGYHPLSGACHVEAVDGELVLTTLHNPSFVLLRYAPGDLGALADDACSCGLRGPRIKTLAGRTHVRFHGQNGAFAAGLLGPLLARLPVLEHQLVQQDDSRYLLRYRGDRELTDASLVLRRLRELAGDDAVLTLARVDRVPRRGRKPEPFVIEREDG